MKSRFKTSVCIFVCVYACLNIDSISAALSNTHVSVFSPQPRHAVKLLSVLKYMAHRSGPDSFFSFPGKNAAVSI